MNKTIGVITGIVLCLFIGGLIYSSKNESTGSTPLETPTPGALVLKTNTPTETMKPSTVTKPEMKIDKAKTYEAVLATSKGEIVVALHAKETPITVNNFVYLARQGFYDNTIFHRTIKDFMIQGGDPKGDGTGGPGYKFDDEAFTGSYKKGIVAMANSGPDTNGSQFFIMHADYPLPPNYVIFGEVTKGIEVVDAIASAPVKASRFGELSVPVTPVAVTTITIREQ